MVPVNTVIGTVKPLLMEYLLSTIESPLNLYNNGLVRRVMQERPSPPGDGISTSNITHGEELHVPIHLQSLFKQITARQGNKSAAEPIPRCILQE